MLEGYGLRREQHLNDLISQAWHTAALYRVDRMPDLESLLITRPSGRVQTPEDMETIVTILNAAFGGETILSEE